MSEKQTKGSAQPDIDAIAGSLEEDIALGRILPRERLIEEELALRFGVNRHVIRQVLTELDAMGLVVRQKNKGATVRDVTPEDVVNIYAVRETLEAKAAELIRLPLDRLVLETLRQIHERHREAARSGNLTQVFRLNLLFHKLLFEACGNPQLAEAIQHFALKAHIARSITFGNPDLLARAVEEHARIVACLESGDRTNLVRIVVEHLGPSRDAYLRRASSRQA